MAKRNVIDKDRAITDKKINKAVDQLISSRYPIKRTKSQSKKKK